MRFLKIIVQWKRFWSGKFCAMKIRIRIGFFFRCDKIIDSVGFWRSGPFDDDWGRGWFPIEGKGKISKLNCSLFFMWRFKIIYSSHKSGRYEIRHRIYSIAQIIGRVACEVKALIFVNWVIVKINYNFIMSSLLEIFKKIWTHLIPVMLLI